MTTRGSVEALLPLKPVDFHILLVLTDGALHGYGMVKEIEARSEGRIRMEPGNLYRHIRRLVEQGLVEPAGRRHVPDEGKPGPGGRRRYYRVTPFGQKALGAEVVRMRNLVADVEARLPDLAESQ